MCPYCFAITVLMAVASQEAQWQQNLHHLREGSSAEYKSGTIWGTGEPLHLL